MKLTRISILLTCFFGQAAMATALLDSSNYWVGAGLGAAQLEESSSKHETTMRAFSSKLDAGFDINDHLGLYASYDFMQYIPEDKDIHLGTLGLRGKYALTEQLKLVGKVGATSPFNEGDDSGFSTSMGLGMEYQLTHALSTRMGVDYYHDLSLRNDRKGDLYQAYWGLSYRFGQPDTPMVVIEEVVKEVPIEVIKEVVKEVQIEVIKEVVVEKEVRKHIFGDLIFKSNSSELASGYLFDDMVDLLADGESLGVAIVGHTDSLGSDSYNQALSLQRAQSVADYLQQKGIVSSRITVEGKGEAQPIADNKTSEGRALNRRVELSIY
ncbi:OmpA family protein [Vibrio sp. OPT18]|uniref:OmpA family protein n=1 Tax=Vibrio sp. OPT18 TaxID=2778641 RepID=UPI00188144F6|nr:OmpA family protein [Vibrio sp. OPT18]MBE8574167.1 OmpA family protein [Vibrio sp. OPT18]